MSGWDWEPLAQRMQPLPLPMAHFFLLRKGHTNHSGDLTHDQGQAVSPKEARAVFSQSLTAAPVSSQTRMESSASPKSLLSLPGHRDLSRICVQGFHSLGPVSWQEDLIPSLITLSRKDEFFERILTLKIHFSKITESFTPREIPSHAKVLTPKPQKMCHQELAAEQEAGVFSQTAKPFGAFSRPDFPQQLRLLPGSAAAAEAVGQGQQDVCPGSAGGSAGLGSLKQLGPAPCKLDLSPLSLRQLLCPQWQLLHPPCSCCPGAHPGTAVCPEPPGCTPRRFKEPRDWGHGCHPRAGGSE